MPEPLLAQILATPDDDAPRLVWADREGGVHGELVVIQCRLAQHETRRDLARPELTRLLEREAEILAQFHAAGSRYERGFAVHSNVRDDDLTREGVARLLQRQPLLRSVDLLDTYWSDRSHDISPKWSVFLERRAARLAQLPDGVTEITASPIFDRGDDRSYADEFLELLAKTRQAPTLRVLRIHAEVKELDVLDRFPALEELWLQPLAPDALVGFLERHPRVRRLRVLNRRQDQTFDRLFASPVLGQLVELQLELLSAANLRLLARSPHLGKLEWLSLHRSWPDRDVAAHDAIFAAVPGITRLDLYEATTDAVIAAVARAPFARNLRLFSLSDGQLTAASIPVLERSFPALERLYMASSHHKGAIQTELAKTRASIPYVVV